MAWRVYIRDDLAAFETALAVVTEHPNGDRKILRGWTMEPMSRVSPTKPTVSLEHDEMDDLLQAFTDAAWERGIRPRQIEDQRNQVKAMESHLLDLRRVSFKLLKIEDSGK